MQTLVVTSLFLLAGAALYSGVHHLGMGIVRANHAPYLWFSVFSFSLAAYTLCGLPLYSSLPMADAIFHGKLVVATGILAWLGLLWFGATYTGRYSLPVPVLLTSTWALLFVINLVSPYSIVFQDIQLQETGDGAMIWRTAASPWLIVLYTTVFLSLAYLGFLATQLFQAGAVLPALMPLPGLVVVTACAVVDALIDAGVLVSTYLTPFGLGFLMTTMGLYLALGRWSERAAYVTADVTGSTEIPAAREGAGILGAVRRAAYRVEGAVRGAADAWLQVPTPRATAPDVEVPLAPRAFARVGTEAPRPAGKGHIVAGCDINHLIEDVGRGPRGTPLRLDLQPGLPPVRVARSAILRVLLMLLRNAREPVGADPVPVAVATRRLDDARIEIRISDSGTIPDFLSVNHENLVQTLRRDGQLTRAARLHAAGRIVSGLDGDLRVTRGEPGIVYRVTLPCG